MNYEILINRLDHNGRGIGKINNKIVFVPYALIGEKCSIKITSEKKKFYEAELLEVLLESEKRCQAICPYYYKCGGCDLLHTNYINQLDYKENKIKDIITRYTSLDSNIVKEIVSSDYFNYRNKVVIHINKDKLGFYKNKTNELIEIDNCLLLDKKINEIISLLKKFIKIERNLTKATIKLGNETDEVMLILRGDIINYDFFKNVVDVLIINGKAITKKDYILSIIGDKKYKVSENSFFQVNKFVTKKLYDEVKSIVKNLNSKNVLDLYSGTGTIGIYIADNVDSVTGIEVVDDAVRDANFNKRLNNVKNINFIRGKVEDKINSVDRNIDTVILDPPRSGLHKKVIEFLKKINTKNIIYVSCDPITLSRDLNLLSNDYKVDYIKLFDMFPNTYHVECVCVLNRR